MLCLMRKKDEEIYIGREISIKVYEIRGNSCKLGVRAPDNVTILRGELFSEEDTPGFRISGRIPNAVYKFAWCIPQPTYSEVFMPAFCDFLEGYICARQQVDTTVTRVWFPIAFGLRSILLVARCFWTMLPGHFTAKLPWGVAATFGWLAHKLFSG